MSSLSQEDIKQLVNDVEELLFTFGEMKQGRMLDMLEAQGWNREKIMQLIKRYYQEKRKRDST